MTKERIEFREKLVHLLNSTSQENSSNTPDYILADYLLTCLDGFDAATRARDKWYGVKLVPGASKYPKAP